MAVRGDEGQDATLTTWTRSTQQPRHRQLAGEGRWAGAPAGAPAGGTAGEAGVSPLEGTSGCADARFLATRAPGRRSKACVAARSRSKTVLWNVCDSVVGFIAFMADTVSLERRQGHGYVSYPSIVGCTAPAETVSRAFRACSAFFLRFRAFLARRARCCTVL